MRKKIINLMLVLGLILSMSIIAYASEYSYFDWDLPTAASTGLSIYQLEALSDEEIMLLRKPYAEIVDAVNTKFDLLNAGSYISLGCFLDINATTTRCEIIQLVYTVSLAEFEYSTVQLGISLQRSTYAWMLVDAVYASSGDVSAAYDLQVALFNYRDIINPVELYYIVQDNEVDLSHLIQGEIELFIAEIEPFATSYTIISRPADTNGASTMQITATITLRHTPSPNWYFVQIHSTRVIANNPWTLLSQGQHSATIRSHDMRYAHVVIQDVRLRSGTSAFPQYFTITRSEHLIRAQ
jgi:hypothetical protein